MFKDETTNEEKENKDKKLSEVFDVETGKTISAFETEA